MTARPTTRLLGIAPSTRRDKKLMATFVTAKGSKVVHFGGAGCQDYTKYSEIDPVLARKKRMQYIARHRVNEDWSDPTTPATLSRFILWERPTIISAITAYKRRFKV